MPTVIIHSNGKQTDLKAEKGQILLDWLSENGFSVTAPCGGCNRCGGCKIKASGMLSEMSAGEEKLLDSSLVKNGIRLACFASIEGDCEIFLENDDGSAIQTKFAYNAKSNVKSSGFGLAVDIGTTTVAVYLYDLTNGTCAATAAKSNDQRKFGSDVITRINACAAPGALKQITDTIVNQLNEMTQELCKNANANISQITDCVIAANTTMLHFLCGFDPTGIANAPFIGESLFGIEYHSSQLGLKTACPVYLAPCVSSYVGGDITAGMNSVKLQEASAPVLYLDIGTNGEIALAKDGNIICCSAAAGPVFEGAHIKYGMPGIPGAINKVFLEDGKIKYEVIGGINPKGICGSGIIDAVSLMLKQEIIDETGYLKDDFIISPEAGIAVTPADIREIQLAKSAIFSGIARLLKEWEINPGQIEKMILAGGFGSNINAVSAAEIGLFEKELAGRCVFVGNAAGMGAAFSLINSGFRESLECITDSCEYIELSGDKIFYDMYIENMMFNI